MKLKEVVAMLNEYAKVAGADCEVQVSEIRLMGRIVEDYSDPYNRYGTKRKQVPLYYIVATEYAQPPANPTQDTEYPA